MPFVWLLVRLLIYILAMLTGAGVAGAAQKLAAHRRARKAAAQKKSKEYTYAQRFK